MNKFNFNPKYVAIPLAIGLIVYTMSFLVVERDDGLPSVSGISTNRALVITGCLGTAEAERNHHLNDDSKFLGEVIGAYYESYVEHYNLTINSKGRKDIKLFASKLRSDTERANALAACADSMVNDNEIRLLTKAVKTASKKTGILPDEFKTII